MKTIARTVLTTLLTTLAIVAAATTLAESPPPADPHAGAPHQLAQSTSAILENRAA